MKATRLNSIVERSLNSRHSNIHHSISRYLSSSCSSLFFSVSLSPLYLSIISVAPESMPTASLSCDTASRKMSSQNWGLSHSAERSL